MVVSSKSSQPVFVNLFQTLAYRIHSVGLWHPGQSPYPRELHPSITINNVLPGFTDTERLGSLAQSIHERTGQSVEAIHDGWMSQVPIERLIDPLETASVIAFLASPAAGAIRGVSLPVDGGRLRSI